MQLSKIFNKLTTYFSFKSEEKDFVKFKRWLKFTMYQYLECCTVARGDV